MKNLYPLLLLLSLSFAALSQKPDFDIVLKNGRVIDPDTGLLATPNCPGIRTEFFIAGTEPGAMCPHGGAMALPVSNRRLH